MYILSIETTGKYGSVALIDGAAKAVSRSSNEEMNHLQNVMVLVDQCLQDEAIIPDKLSAVAASIGPGSFTGIRIGVSTARAIAEVLELPCVAVSSLEGMAALADEHVEPTVRYFAPIINARRGQLYGALFVRAGKGYKAVIEERQYMIDEFLNAVKQMEVTDSELVFVGDGIDAYETEIRNAGAFVLAPVDWRYQDAAPIARLALRRFRAGAVVNYEKLIPNYMRKSEAEMRLESGTLSSKIGKLQC